MCSCCRSTDFRRVNVGFACICACLGHTCSRMFVYIKMKASLINYKYTNYMMYNTRSSRFEHGMKLPWCIYIYIYHLFPFNRRQMIQLVRSYTAVILQIRILIRMLTFNPMPMHSYYRLTAPWRSGLASWLCELVGSRRAETNLSVMVVHIQWICRPFLQRYNKFDIDIS